MDGESAQPYLPAVAALDLAKVWRPMVEAFARLALGAVTTGGG
jgi:hypothetical protein